jgi:hypothetical protein
MGICHLFPNPFPFYANKSPVSPENLDSQNSELDHIVHPFANKFRILVRLAKLALVAIPLLVLALILNNRSPWAQLCLIGAVVFCLPCFIFAYVLTILHWKSRYRGTHSDLWGVLLLLEASGWFKLIYIFRHIRPDMKGRGRYSHDNVVV